VAAGPLLAGVVEQPLAEVFQTAWDPASLTASAFWISTVRPQRRQATRSR
jgi:hypothetical protein